jgi:hypothetical protein
MPATGKEMDFADLDQHDLMSELIISTHHQVEVWVSHPPKQGMFAPVKNGVYNSCDGSVDTRIRRDILGRWNGR